MLRSLSLIAAATLIAAPVSAANYAARLSAPTSGRVIARDIVWACGADACQGSTLESRPVVLCQSLAKRAGRVDSFTVDGRDFTSTELGKCNAVAKEQPVQALAAQ